MGDRLPQQSNNPQSSTLVNENVYLCICVLSRYLKIFDDRLPQLNNPTECTQSSILLGENVYLCYFSLHSIIIYIDLM